MLEQKLVTIAMPTYNAEKTLSQAIRSIVLQTYTNWELLIIDDGSSDRSVSIAEGFKDTRITVIPNRENRGISARLNLALELSKGEYFARMDGDDVSFPARLEKQVEFMLANPAVDLLASRTLIYNGNGCPCGIITINESHEDICRKPWAGFYLPHPTWLGRTEWLLKHGYRSYADGAEDQELLFRTHKSSRFACLPDVLLAYREEQRSLKKMFRARYKFFSSILRECCLTKNYYYAFRLMLLQPVKIVGDILNIKFKIKLFRNTINAASPELLNQWTDVWTSVNR